MGQVNEMTKTATTRGDGSPLKFARKTLAAVLPALVILAVTAAAAYAAGEEHGEAVDPTQVIWRIVDFAIIAIGLVVLYFKVIRGALRKRIEGIESALAEAKAAREEALTRLADVEARLKDKDAELAKLVSVAEENGSKEKASLIAEGDKISNDILSAARDGIDAELIKAKDELRREAALLAVELAEKLVKENISAADRSRIIEEYIAKVGG